MIRFTKTNKNTKYHKNVKYLYEHAFPIEERPPFNMLMSCDNQDTYEISEEDNFIGLITTVNYEDLLYIFFLAIRKKYRRHGYGTKILNEIMNNNKDKRIYLLAEDPDIESDNKVERNNRISFYKKNGLYSTNVKIKEYGCDYVVLSNNKKVTKTDFLMTMRYIIGDDWFNKYYVKNVS